jgi:hypothetical protein
MRACLHVFLSVLVAALATAGAAEETLTLELVAEAGVGDGGAALEAPIGEVTGLAIDTAGNLYLAIPGQRRVRRVAPDGTITTIAGVGAVGGIDRDPDGIGEPTAVAIGKDAPSTSQTANVVGSGRSGMAPFKLRRGSRTRVPMASHHC